MQAAEQKKYNPPLTFEQLVEMWNHVLSGEKSVELFLAQLARSGQTLSEEEAVKLQKIVEESVL